MDRGFYGRQTEDSSLSELMYKINAIDLRTKEMQDALRRATYGKNEEYPKEEKNVFGFRWGGKRTKRSKRSKRTRVKRS